MNFTSAFHSPTSPKSSYVKRVWGLFAERLLDSASRRAWSYTVWKIFGDSQKVSCDIRLFTGICSLEDTLNKRKLSFWSRLANTNNEVILTWKTCLFTSNCFLVRFHDFMFSVCVGCHSWRNKLYNYHRQRGANCDAYSLSLSLSACVCMRAWTTLNQFQRLRDTGQEQSDHFPATHAWEWEIFDSPLCAHAVWYRSTNFRMVTRHDKVFRLDAWALSVIAMATWLGGWVAGWVAGCPSHSGIVSKRLNLSENFFDHLKVPSF